MTIPVNIRVCDRLADAAADRAAFMQELCDELTQSLRAGGAGGGEIEDVVWLKAHGDGALEGAIIVARPAPGGFERMTADACRAIIAARIAAEQARRAEAQAEGRLL